MSVKHLNDGVDSSRYGLWLKRDHHTKTVKEVLSSFTDEQKKVLYFMIEKAIEESYKKNGGLNMPIAYKTPNGDYITEDNNYNEIRGTWNQYYTIDESAAIDKYLIPEIKRIERNYKNGNVYTTVIWEDGSKPTVVKLSDSDLNNIYFAVAAAISIKRFGSNSAFQRIICDKVCIKNKEAAPDLLDKNFLCSLLNYD